MQSESQLQTAIYTWFHNAYPHLRGLLCYNLNNSRNKIDGNRNRALGLQKGRADMVFYYAGRAYHIEIKTETGEQSPAQKKWQRLIESHGFSYYIVRSEAEFQQLVTEIIV